MNNQQMNVFDDTKHSNQTATCNTDADDDDTVAICFVCMGPTSPFRDVANPPCLLECAHVMCTNCAHEYLNRKDYIQCKCTVIDYELPITVGRPSNVPQPLLSFKLEVTYFPFQQDPVPYTINDFKMTGTAAEIVQEVAKQSHQQLSEQYNLIYFYIKGRHIWLSGSYTLKSIGYWPHDNKDGTEQRIIIRDSLLPENCEQARRRREKYVDTQPTSPKQFSVQLQTIPPQIKMKLSVTNTTTFDDLANHILSKYKSKEEGVKLVPVFNTGVDIVWNSSTTLGDVRAQDNMNIIFHFNRR